MHETTHLQMQLLQMIRSNWAQKPPDFESQMNNLKKKKPQEIQLSGQESFWTVLISDCSENTCFNNILFFFLFCDNFTLINRVFWDWQQIM